MNRPILGQYGTLLRHLGARAVPAAANAALVAAGCSADQISVLHMALSVFSSGITAHARKAA